MYCPGDTEDGVCVCGGGYILRRQSQAMQKKKMKLPAAGGSYKGK